MLSTSERSATQKKSEADSDRDLGVPDCLSSLLLGIVTLPIQDYSTVATNSQNW